MLTSKEVHNAKRTLLRLSQEEVYMDTLELIKKGKQIPKSCPLFKFDLYLSQDGLLTIRSRVRDDLAPLQPRLYTILSLRSSLTKLFVRSPHVEKNHPGASTLLATLAEDYYIPNVKSFLKSLSRTCVVCQKSYLRVAHQQMGMLPTHRTRPSPPFERIGIDFAGTTVIILLRTTLHEYMKGVTRTKVNTVGLYAVKLRMEYMGKNKMVNVSVASRASSGRLFRIASA